MNCSSFSEQYRLSQPGPNGRTGIFEPFDGEYSVWKVIVPPLACKGLKKKGILVTISLSNTVKPQLSRLIGTTRNNSPDIQGSG